MFMLPKTTNDAMAMYKNRESANLGSLKLWKVKVETLCFIGLVVRWWPARIVEMILLSSSFNPTRVMSYLKTQQMPQKKSDQWVIC